MKKLLGTFRILRSWALALMIILVLAGFAPLGAPLPDDLRIGDILLVPIIVALVELAKKLGLPTEFAPWLNGALSLAGYGLMVLVAREPAALEPATYGLNALVVFLMNAGFYDRVQGMISRRSDL